MQNPPGSYPPPQGHQQGGFPQPGGYPPQGGQSGKTQTLGLDFNIAAGLCYIPVCAIGLIASILWIATEPKSSKFVRFHAFQSLFLLVTNLVVGIGGWILSIVLLLALSAVSETLGAIVSLVVSLGMLLIFLGLFVILIMCLIKSFTGQMWKAPVIGNFADKFSS